MFYTNTIINIFVKKGFFYTNGIDRVYMSVYHDYFSPQYTANYNNNLDDIIGPITTKNFELKLKV